MSTIKLELADIYKSLPHEKEALARLVQLFESPGAEHNLAYIHNFTQPKCIYGLVKILMKLNEAGFLEKRYIFTSPFDQRPLAEFDSLMDIPIDIDVPNNGEIVKVRVLPEHMSVIYRRIKP